MPWKRRYDPLEDESLFGAAEAKAKRESDAEVRDRLERMEKLRNDAEERRRVDTSAGWAAMNAKNIRLTYLARGVEVPEWGPNDSPCTLDLLLRIGFTVQEISGKKVLIKPAAAEPWDGFRDRDSLPQNETTRKKSK